MCYFLQSFYLFNLLAINIEKGWIFPSDCMVIDTSAYPFYRSFLSVGSIVSFFENLGDTSEHPRWIFLGTTNTAKLTPQEIAIATNKGYSLL